MDQFWEYSSATALLRFQAWQFENEPQVVPICLAAGLFIAIDLNANDEVVARWFRRHAEEHLGITPVIRRRDGNETRMVLFFKHKDHTAPIGKGASSSGF